MVKPEPFLQGPRIVLRALEAQDISVIARWLNDEAVTHFMFYGQKPWTLEQVADQIKLQTQNPANVVLMIEEKGSGKPIGFAGLYDIHPTARKAEYRVLIGEREVWGKGLGTEVTELFTYYGFDRLNLNRLYLGVTDENMGGVRAYEKSGYKQEGVLRQDIYRNSRYYDSVRMGLLREEYYRELHPRFLKQFSPNAASSKKETVSR